MLNEIGNKETKEIKAAETQSFRDIKQESDMSYRDAKKPWDRPCDDDAASINETPVEQTKEQIQYLDDNGKVFRVENVLVPNTEIQSKGYIFRTDEKGRIISAKGKLQMKDHEGKNPIKTPRQAVGRGEILESDDRGHLIADQFNGSGGLENLVPMDGNLNKGDYKKMENNLADAVKDGKDVHLKVEPVYEGDSYRPTEFRASYTIDGEKYIKVFKNWSGD